METINVEVRDLQNKYENLLEKYAELSASISKTQGEVAEIKRVSTSFSQQTIWQLVGFAVVMASVMITGIYYQTNALRNEMNLRFEAQQQQIKQVENNLNQVEKNLQQQINQLDKNMNARFEDLKQEVRASRK
jgi:peptidoglycan hydrolase CwlO-like protein